MPKVTNNIQKLLQQLANLLPPIRQNSHEKHYVKGSEIIAWQTITKINGQPIVPNQMYLQKYPVLLHINHFSRLKKAYKNGGIAKVQNYLQWVAGLQSTAKINTQMQALQAIIQAIIANTNSK